MLTCESQFQPTSFITCTHSACRLCTFLMYTMWWHKPLSPNEPFVLKGPWVEPQGAYMYMLSEMSGEVDGNSLESQTSVKAMFAFLHLYSKTPEVEDLALKRLLPLAQNDIPSRRNSVTTTVDFNQGSEAIPDLGNGEDQGFVPGLRLATEASIEELRNRKLEKATSTAFFERRPKIKGVTLRGDWASAATIRRWQLASSAVQQYPALLDETPAHSHHNGGCIHIKTEELLTCRVQNWPWDGLLRDVGGLVVGLILWLANFAYGALHAAAWNEHFPTVAEKWLWRSSSVYIGFCGGLWIVLNYAAQAYQPLNEFWEKWMDGGGRRWQNLVLGFPVCICGLSLLFARGFIVIEAFISIRSLPAAAYDTPTWSQIFPHF